jgi:hypothetical protein
MRSRRQRGSPLAVGETDGAYAAVHPAVRAPAVAAAVFDAMLELPSLAAASRITT